MRPSKWIVSYSPRVSFQVNSPSRMSAKKCSQIELLIELGNLKWNSLSIARLLLGEDRQGGGLDYADA
jgi:hypothetical protein